MCIVVTATALPCSSASAATLSLSTTKDEMTAGDHACSLREAIDEINSPPGNGDCALPGGGGNTIVLGPHRYTLSRPADPGDENATGDLNVMSPIPLTIHGAGALRTQIDATGLGDRVLSTAAASNVTLNSLTLTGGHAPDGPRGQNSTNSSSATPGGAGGDGGGIANAGTLTLRLTRIAGNVAGSGGTGGGAFDTGVGPDAGGGSGGSGGGIANRGTLTLIGTTVSRNRAGDGGTGGTADSVNGQTGGDGGDGGDGGGIANASHLTLIRSTVLANVAGKGGTGGGGNSGRGHGGRGGAGGSGGGAFDVGADGATNSTIASNFAGSGGRGGAGGEGDPLGGTGGDGGDGGNGGRGGGYVNGGFGDNRFVHMTISDNGVGSAGTGGSKGPGTMGAPDGTAGGPGNAGSTGGVVNGFGGLTLVNSIVAFNGGGSCAINISNGGHDLIFPADAACPFGLHADPRLRDLGSYGGPTPTFALKLGSPARDQVPTNASCPGIDQRGVHRPQGRACDIGAFEFALPRVRIGRPRDGARYKRGKRVLASFSCIEAGLRTLIRSCRGTVPIGHRIDTSTHGRKRFTVVATDRAGNRVSKTVHYRVQKR